MSRHQALPTQRGLSLRLLWSSSSHTRLRAGEAGTDSSLALMVPFWVLERQEAQARGVGDV
jgi:hypothetical protein